MRLSTLLAEAGLADVTLRGDATVRAVRSDSRAVRGGDCFVAIRGPEADGHRFIGAALAAGAGAIVCEDPSAVPAGVPCAVVKEGRSAIGPLAQASHGWPSRKLTVLAATGTNGKTTFTYLARHLLAAGGAEVALLGTIAYEALGQVVPARNTTPGAVELAETMAAFVRGGGTHLVMEASSHALHQHRMDGIDVAAAVFTNLTGDHLDYHGTMEQYLAAKARLFEGLRDDAWAVLNNDDAACGALTRSTRAQVMRYGLSPAAELSAAIEEITSSGTRFALRWRGRSAPVACPLVGRHNVYNCLSAAGAALAVGMDLAAVGAALATARGAPGRLQRVSGSAPFEVLVDYAHTDDALDNVLAALRPLTPGKLILVFGCGGDRDRSKRPRMAAVAQRRADRIVVTSDNPRTEDPLAILADIGAGFSEAGRRKVVTEPDRRAAIAAALEGAGPGDVVLIAGKGHENYQVIGSERIHFDDVETAEHLLRQRER